MAVVFVGVMVANGNILPSGGDDGSTATTGTTLIEKPKLPGEDSTDTTASGASARCKDGTYSFRAGKADIPDDELCKENGGVEKRLS